MNTATLTRETTETATREFSRHDRCDSCAFQAYFVVLRNRTQPSVHASLSHEDTQEFLFCKHHGDKHTPALAQAGWTVLDFTDKINEKPTDPSDDEF
jgi:hypothetical protein